VAASGGYYVAMAVGDQQRSIYAEPTTTTGSIGVLIPHYDLSGLLARFDVKDDTLATHPRKEMLSMTKPMTDEQRELVKIYMNEAFTRFKEMIKGGRPSFRTDEAALDTLATGEVFTANQAKERGLIDEIGFIEDAIDRVIEMGRSVAGAYPRGPLPGPAFALWSQHGVLAGSSVAAGLRSAGMGHSATLLPLDGALPEPERPRLAAAATLARTFRGVSCVCERDVASRRCVL